MIRDDRFLISRRAYAVDLSSLRKDATSNMVQVRAVWFRKKNGVVAACTGRLWDFQDPSPASAREFLERHDDGRYGGDCDGRWDGRGYWGASERPTGIEKDLALLRPMLENFPAIPSGYDGWYHF